MTGLPLYQVDAFTERPFAGNPAAVVLLEGPVPEDWLQAVAAEMNLSETAFLWRREDGAFDLRWFTPSREVELCGHATLAAAHVLRETGTLAAGGRAEFHTLSGISPPGPTGNGSSWISRPDPRKKPTRRRS